VSDQPPARRRIDPLLVVVVGVGAGILVAALHRPQAGMFIASAALAVGAALRLVLRPRQAGSLVVRSRQVDVLILAGLAVAVGVMAAVTPFPSGGG
jgi:uncharacterized membrane protein